MPAFEARDSYYEYYPTLRSLIYASGSDALGSTGEAGGIFIQNWLGLSSERYARHSKDTSHANSCTPLYVAAGAGSNRNHSGGLRSLRTALRQHKKVVIVVITEHGAKECWITWRFFGFFANDDVYNTSPGCNLLQIATCYRMVLQIAPIHRRPRISALRLGRPNLHTKLPASPLPS